MVLGWWRVAIISYQKAYYITTSHCMQTMQAWLDRISEHWLHLGKCNSISDYWHFWTWMWCTNKFMQANTRRQSSKERKPTAAFLVTIFCWQLFKLTYQIYPSLIWTLSNWPIVDSCKSFLGNFMVVPLALRLETNPAKINMEKLIKNISRFCICF